MSIQNTWKELDLFDARVLATPLRPRRRARRGIRRVLRSIQRIITWLTDSVGVPILVTAASGAVRGETVDLWVSQRNTPAMDALRTWLAESVVHDSTAWFLSRGLPFALVILGILILSVLLIGIRNYIPCIVISEIARRQGRTISLIDLMIANSLPISLAAAIACHGQISVIAIIWFWLAFGFCRVSFHPKRVRGFLDWIVRLRGPMGALNIEAGDVDGHDRDHDS